MTNVGDVTASLNPQPGRHPLRERRLAGSERTAQDDDVAGSTPESDLGPECAHGIRVGNRHRFLRRSRHADTPRATRSSRSIRWALTSSGRSSITR